MVVSRKNGLVDLKKGVFIYDFKPSDITKARTETIAYINRMLDVPRRTLEDRVKGRVRMGLVQAQRLRYRRRRKMHLLPTWFIWLSVGFH